VSFLYLETTCLFVIMYSRFVTASAKKSAKSQKSKLSREKTGGSEGTRKMFYLSHSAVLMVGMETQCFIIFAEFVSFTSKTGKK